MKTKIKKINVPNWLSPTVTIQDFQLKPEEPQGPEYYETNFKPKSKAVKLKNKKLRAIEKKKIRVKSFQDIIKKLPEPDERIFIIGGGNIDAIHSIEIALSFAKKIEEMYVATWSITQDNIESLFSMFDAKKIGSINFILSLFFRGRYKSELEILRAGMETRGQRFIIAQNHSKIILMKFPGFNLVVDGSANFTCNPRIEQINFTNSKELYDFNREWMESVLKMGGK
jgi:hypothetical protein